MRRGEVWTLSGTGHAGEPRPAVVVQDGRFDATASVSVCAFTTDATEAPLFRLVTEPDDHNRLRLTSRLMVDKITTVPRTRLGERIGRLAAPDLARLNRAIAVFLGLA